MFNSYTMLSLWLVTQEATDENNLAQMYIGWAAYMWATLQDGHRSASYMSVTFQCG